MSISDQSLINLYNTLLIHFNFDQYSLDSSTRIFMPLELDLESREISFELREEIWPYEKIEIPFITRIEIYIKAVTSHIANTTRTRYTDSLGEEYFDYDFEVKQDDLSNLYVTPFDNTNLIAYIEVDKTKGVVRIGYK